MMDKIKNWFKKNRINFSILLPVLIGVEDEAEYRDSDPSQLSDDHAKTKAGIAL